MPYIVESAITATPTCSRGAIILDSVRRHSWVQATYAHIIIVSEELGTWMDSGSFGCLIYRTAGKYVYFCAQLRPSCWATLPLK